jgi:outer membrane protein OmpA-like peptidoglycan-associated protein
MKKLTLLLFFVGGIVFAQNDSESINENNKTLILKLGINVVDSTGEESPLDTFNSDFDQVAFSSPYMLELEYRFSNLFGLALSASVNRWKKNEGVIDGTLLNKDEIYTAIDLDLKYYFDESLNFLDRYEWLDLYLHGGIGYFKIKESDCTLNFGPGANIWFNESVGLNLSGTGKWALNHGGSLYDTNHFQISAGILFRFNGAEADFDDDGIRDSDDKCPKVYGLQSLDGCPEEVVVAPKDSDGDGVIDDLDTCPNVKGPKANKGCPYPDTDNDGVLDKDDTCPNVKGPKANKGCPYPDTDNDGILDKDDKCPNVKGLAEYNGCPFKEVTVGETNSALNKLTPKILFNTSSDNINKASYTALQQISQIMKQHPEASFRLEGHTDSMGAADFNSRLSKNRVMAVRDYLVDHGIPAQNLTTEYFGESKPIASNATREGRQQNRRVEVIRTK